VPQQTDASELTELLTDHTSGWAPPPMRGVPVVAQAHCHQHAVLGWDADQKLLAESGASVDRLDSGCCGLAGNFGFEAGHLDVSTAWRSTPPPSSTTRHDPDIVIRRSHSRVCRAHITAT
jgi:hypothetical protein